MPLANVRYNLRDWYFGDMRANKLEVLSLLPLTDQLEMANSIPNVMAKLSAADFYPPLFTAAFGDSQITPERIAQALAQFLRSLVSYRAPLDASLPGRPHAILPGGHAQCAGERRPAPVPDEVLR